MLLNFKKRFVEPIRNGTKHHTIRADRKDGYVPKPGEPLYLYCGARTKHCFKILEQPPPCTKVLRITIDDKRGSIRWNSITGNHIICGEVTIDGTVLSDDECDRLAIADGFSSFPDMMEFWSGRLPFKGNIIHWR